jgi:NADH:ubiquinone oxidoreductase subunit 4 (subunit M)
MYTIIGLWAQTPINRQGVFMKNRQDAGTTVLGKKYIWILASLLMMGMFGFIGNVSSLLPIRQFPGAVVAACLEAVVTAVITVFLLKAQTTEQTEAELKKERFAVLFAKKSETYDAYLSDLVAIANRGSITKEEFTKLVDDLNFKVNMYVSEK